MIQLSEREKCALRGELSFDEFEELGMGLFKKGLVALDPLAVGRGNAFPLTDEGRRVARELRG